MATYVITVLAHALTVLRHAEGLGSGRVAPTQCTIILGFSFATWKITTQTLSQAQKVDPNSASIEVLTAIRKMIVVFGLFLMAGIMLTSLYALPFSAGSLVVSLIALTQIWQRNLIWSGLVTTVSSD